MDGENNGKTLLKWMDDLGGKPTIFGNIHISIWVVSHGGVWSYATSRTRWQAEREEKGKLMDPWEVPGKCHAKIIASGTSPGIRLFFKRSGQVPDMLNHLKLGSTIILNCRLQQFLCFFFELRSSTSFRVGGKKWFFSFGQKSRWAVGSDQSTRMMRFFWGWKTTQLY